jgi:polyhydroxybutyrate depolymerase
VYRGFATVAASFYADALCADAPPRPFAMFHGTDDVVVPYGGGPVNAGAAGNGLSVQPAEATAAAWAEHHGCDPEPTVDAISDTVDRFTWGGCEAPVELYRVGGGGHTWPGAAIAVDRLGATNADVDASRTMLELWGIVSD